MSKQREALKLALEALQFAVYGEPVPSLEVAAITAIREALAEPFDPVQDAAPDLLEALDDLILLAQAVMHENGGYMINDELSDARAAIAKAKGEV